ncbi:MAG: dihydrodipicolinate synthase family protein [Gammaproteobacteria bacterium]|nr:dihydrodipicolinate synthase family protein [Gammaproteobacteria bacterium]
MNRHTVDWHGPMPAIVTIFDERGNIDASAMQAHIDRLFDAGATGILVGGCTGEFWALNAEERAELFGLGVRCAAGRGTVLAGTGAVTIRETLRLTQAAADAGCDGALILPPYFIRLSDDEIFEHYRAIDSEIELPVVLYNIPGNAINAITPELAVRLAELKHVVAIKESSGDWNNFYRTLIAVRDRLRVFCGPASIFGVPAVAAGADGFIDCFPNVWLPGGIDMYAAAVEGRHDEANRLQVIGRQLTDLFTSGGRSLYPSTKAAMNYIGYLAGDPRPPLLPLDGDALAGLRAGLRRLGVK